MFTLRNKSAYLTDSVWTEAIRCYAIVWRSLAVGTQCQTNQTGVLLLTDLAVFLQSVVCVGPISLCEGVRAAL